MNGKTRRSTFQIMRKLIVLVYPLLHIMLAAILLGVVGYLCAIFLSVFAGEALLTGVSDQIHGLQIIGEDPLGNLSLHTIFIMMVVMAVFRGILHYAEQYCNHFIAFKLLAIIRHEVFSALRKLCPAKLEGKDKGNLISIITTDIELLEVFYAHTISPTAIAFLTSFIMILFFAQFHWYAALLALLAYLVVGVLIPIYQGKRGSDVGLHYRTDFGDLNSFVLDSLRGLDETIQYGQGEQREKAMMKRSKALTKVQEKLSHLESDQRSLTNLAILLFSFGMLFLTLYLYQDQQIGIHGVLICTIAMIGSFGPVAALSNLSNNLNQTLASGERVLSILEESPQVQEVADKEDWEWKKTNSFAEFKHVSFAYDQEVIVQDYALTIPQGGILGIYGKSGSGKSTLLKLLMRFWDVEQGEISLHGENIKTIPTRKLRDEESYVTQETHLFHDSIANNIAIGKPNATIKEIMGAAKKASIHDFIMSLPNAYDTKVIELGDSLSGGERQRIGIARAFLHDAPFLLLDEPTSNLDALNEGIILQSIQASCQSKTVILISHRLSTLQIADTVLSMNSQRES